MSTSSSRRGSPLLRAAAGATVLVALAACRKAPPPPPPPGPAAYATSGGPAAPTGGNAAAPAPFASFTDVAGEAGIGFVHENGARGRKYLPETMGSGVAVLDYDGDGRMDLYFVDSMPWPGEEGAEGPAPTGRLYRNLGGRFADVTKEAGLDRPCFGMGAVAGDFDGDGDPDLFVTAVGACTLWRNDGGRFTDVAAAAGVAGEPWTDEAGRPHDPVWSCAAFLDFDRDGVLDLYAGRYVRWSRESDVFTTMDGKTKAYTVPDRYRGDSGRLYRGRGDGAFEDATRKAGLWRDDAKALGVAACDLDGDGWTDLVVANDGEPNHLFLNRGDGTFLECGLPAGIAYDAQGKARADMGIAVGPVDPDGLPVVVTGTFSQEALAFYRRQTRAKGLSYVDDGPAAGLAGPTYPSLTFGVLLQDLDLDGRLDLVIANGHIEPTVQSIMREITYAQAPQAFRNRGDGRFEDATSRAGPAFAAPAVGRGLAWLDYDADGDPDLVLAQNGGPARLLRNDAPPGRRSLRLRLEGAGGNRDALGAVVTVTAGGRSLALERWDGGSYFSDSEPTLLFGLGASAAAERVVVRWPGRESAEQDLGPLAAGLWRVQQGAPAVRLGE